MHVIYQKTNIILSCGLTDKLTYKRFVGHNANQNWEKLALDWFNAIDKSTRENLIQNIYSKRAKQIPRNKNNFLEMKSWWLEIYQNNIFHEIPKYSFYLRTTRILPGRVQYFFMYKIQDTDSIFTKYVRNACWHEYTVLVAFTLLPYQLFYGSPNKK